MQPMNKLILISALCLSVAACGGDDAKTAAKNVAKSTAEKIADSTGASTETVAKAGEMAEKAVATVAASFDKKAAVAEAKAITKAFGGALKSKLKSAMKAGGPINALDVCNKEAAPIAEKVAKEKGAAISRVSLKNRNPDNVPNDWQRAVLEDFDARAAKGENVKKMGYAKVVEHDGKKQLRFMKALPTGGLCLDCHGANIEPDVQAKLTELYPDDKATGYEKGQVRGAVVVIKEFN